MSGSDQPGDADARIAAESLTLRRAALDPIRAVAAAESAGFAAEPTERAALGGLLERLEDLGSATLGGDREGRTRIATLVVADAFVRGEERILWVGPRPRALDRLCARCERRLVEVRNERGAYGGAGVFWLRDLESAPPGLGGAEPFARVVHVGAPIDETPWQGASVFVRAVEGAVDAPALTVPAAVEHCRPASPEANAADAALREPLLCLEPSLGPLARRAASGTNADRRAVLGRLTTRLGRMVRAARAKRSDDGAETARQLASDHDGIDEALLEEALVVTAMATPDAETLEAERARLEELRASLDSDPILELLVERARAALAEGVGAALVLPGRASREAAIERLGDVVANGESVEKRLEAARAPAVAVLGVAEHRDERLDRLAYDGLRVIADVRTPIDEATELIGEGPEHTADAPAPLPTPDLDADDSWWAHLRATLALDSPTAHPSSRAAIAEALERSPAPWSLAHLRRGEGDALIIAGPEREREPSFRTIEEGVFHAELALLRVARVRLERALGAARDRWTSGRAELASRRRAAESAIEDARRRKERALGDDARRDAARALEEAEARLAPLDDDERSLAETHEADRERALERFAARGSVEAVSDGDAPSSHPRARVVG